MNNKSKSSKLQAVVVAYYAAAYAKAISVKTRFLAWFWGAPPAASDAAAAKAAAAIAWRR